MSKPRPASPGQLIALNGIGALQLVEVGAVAPLDFESAWAALQDAQAHDLWEPKRKRAEPASRDGTFSA